MTDIHEAAVERVVKEFGAKSVEPDEILTIPCDIFAPCALGAVLDDVTIPKLRCRIVAGSANNVLAESGNGERSTNAAYSTPLTTS